MDTENGLLPDDLATGQQIDDYLIGEPLSQGSHTMTWSATQLSVQREVTICNLYGQHRSDPEVTEAFMADVRKKATIDHPLIGSILEAVQKNGQYFFTSEKLRGETLQSKQENKIKIPPCHVAYTIRSIADASRNIENQNIATLPLSEHDIITDDEFHCRIANMAIAGEPDPDVSTQDKQFLGNLLQGMLQTDQPGATRTGSLLDYMINGHEDHPLSWEQIHRLAEEIEHYLADHQKASENTHITKKPAISSATVAKAGIVLASIAIVAGIAYYIINRKTVPAARDLTQQIEIATGDYQGPLGTSIAIQKFHIDAHEVSIGEYAKFLKALSLIPAEQRAVYQHKEQPEDKTGHSPDDWENLYNAATTGEKWNDLTVDLNYPVVGVDWWDAHAYAEWQGRRLPTREEWYSSYSSSKNAASLKGTGWMPVDETEKTSHGIYGMAGNVSEWTLKPSFDSADPSKPARFIACGGSYLRLKYGARAFEWINNRSLRRPDLGFRTCSDTP